MSSKQLINAIRNGQAPLRTPIVPSFYEYTAKMVGKTISETAQSADLIVQGQLECYKRYKHDFIAVGVDIYNVEHEALGAKYEFFDKFIPDSKDILIKKPEDLKSLKVPDPFKDARMPLYLVACEKINKEVGDEVVVTGTIMGPFTLAVINRTYEELIMDMIDDEDFAKQQLEFAYKVGLEFGKAFVDIGVGITMNESWISPPLLPPSYYTEHVQEYEKRLIHDLKEYGANIVTLISGGEMGPVIDELCDTGTNLVLCNYVNDRQLFKSTCKKYDTLMRASIDPKELTAQNYEVMESQIKEVYSECASYNGFILGCGVVPYEASDESVKAFMQLARKHDPRLK